MIKETLAALLSSSACITDSSALSSDFRNLHSKEASFTSKLDSANRLLGGLSLSSGYGALLGPQSLPPLVTFHYIKGLLNWAVSAVTKGGGKKGGGAPKDGAALPPAQEGRLQPGCWKIITCVLASPAIPPTYHAPGPLMPAATTLLSQLSGVAQQQLQQQHLLPLLGQCSRLLQLLGGKFCATQRPPLEHAVGLAEAALLGLQGAGTGASQAAWVQVAEAAVAILQATVATHPVPRKVWEGVLPRLALPLAAAAFPAAPGSAAAADGKLGDNTLPALSKSLLEAVLFNPVHIPGLAEACEAEFSAASSVAAGMVAAGDGAQEGKAQPGSATGSHTHRHYAGQLLELLSSQLLLPLHSQGAAQQAQQPPKKKARREGGQGPGQAQAGAGAGPLGGSAESVVRLLPWILESYCTALDKYRRKAAAEAALLKQRGPAKRRGQDDSGEGAGLNEAAGTSAGAGSSSIALPAAADFHMFAALLRLLLGRAEGLATGGAEGQAAELALTIRSMASLTVPLKTRQVYRPTQDPQGTHQAVLQHLADAMLALAAKHAQQGHSADDVAGAVLRVLQGILAVEHRPIQARLPALWGLLLAPPPSPAAPSSDMALRVRDEAAAAAVAVSCSLVGAYAQLRQLETLLGSLADALLEEQGAGPAAAGSTAGEGETATAAAAAAARVVGSGAFLVALGEAVRGLPSGQVAAVVRWVAGRVGGLGERDPSDPLLPVFTEVASCCLSSLAVDLTTAPAVAIAAESLVAALCPALLQLLVVVVDRCMPVGGNLLPSLLYLYTLALGLHARCAALHPQVSPLPGQQVQVRAESLEADRAVPASLEGGYFAALLPRTQHKAGSSVPELLCVLPMLLPQQAEHEGASKGSGAPSGGAKVAARAPLGGCQPRLALPAVQAAVQRMRVLHQRHLCLQYLCPTATAAVPLGTGQEQQDGEQDAGGEGAEARARRLAEARAAVAGRLREGAEKELQGLASLVLQAALSLLSGIGSGSGGVGYSMPQQGGEGQAEAVWREVLAHADMLQAWAPADALQRLLQACMELAASPEQSAQQVRCAQRAAALRLLAHPDLLDWPGVRQGLRRALCCQLHPLLRELANAGAAAAAAAAPAPKQSRKKKRKEEGGSNPAPGAHALASGVEGLAGQVKRLGRGKAIKPADWAADVEACIQGIARGVGAVAEAAAGEDPGTDAGAGSAGNPETASRKKEEGERKRKAEEGGADLAEGAAAVDLPRLRASVEGLGSLLGLLAQLPLQHLGARGAEGRQEAAGLTYAAMAAAAAVCVAGARGCSLVRAQQDYAEQSSLALSMLRTLSSALLLLSKALTTCWLPPSHCQPGGREEEQPSGPAQRPAALLLVPDWPSALSTLCMAAAMLATAAAAAPPDPAPSSPWVSGQQMAEEVWERCSDLMASYTAACLLSTSSLGASQGAQEPLNKWLSSLPENLGLGVFFAEQEKQQQRQAGHLAAAAAAAMLSEASLSACHGCLLAAAAAPVWAVGSSRGQHAAAGNQVACGPAAALPPPSGLATSAGLGLQHMLVQCRADGEGVKVNSALVASIAQQLQPRLVGAALASGGGDGHVPGGGSSSVAAAGPSQWLKEAAVGRAYGGLAHVLRMLCLAHPAADSLHAQQGQQAGQRQQGPGGGSAAAAMGTLLQHAAAQLLPGGGGGGGLSGTCSPALLRLVAFLGACCELSHRMRPAPSAAHFASLLALLLCLLCALRRLADRCALDPTRHTLPFTAIFPAAAAREAQQANAGAANPAVGATQARAGVLEALRSLVAGCTTQQLSQMLRYVERSLPSSQGGSGSAQHLAGGVGLGFGGIGGGACSLTVVELALMLLEASPGSRAGRVLGQHGDRFAAGLTGYVATAAAVQAPTAGRGSSDSGQGALAPPMREVMHAVLAAAAAAVPAAGASAGGISSQLPLSSGEHHQQQQQHREGPTVSELGTQQLQQQQRQQGEQEQEDVGALCTALRGLESLAARPQVFAMSARHIANMVHSVAATWAARAAWGAGGPCAGMEGGGASDRPQGVGMVLSVRGGAALFTGSSTLLLAILRHREKELARCLPLLLQAARSLLVWLVGSELTAKLAPGHPGDVPAWRVKCAEALARVLTELATHKRSASRYCPHLIADYLILAASPLTPKAQGLLGLACSEGEAEDVTALGSSEAEPLAGATLCTETAAALRQGAYALYGACSSVELQYLYASLGQRGGAVWRAALATLKSDYEQHYKYTGKV